MEEFWWSGSDPGDAPPVTIAAIALVVFSAMLHASWNAVIKRSGSPMGFFFLLELVTAVVGAPVLLFFDWSAFDARLGWLLLVTAVVHAIYSWCLTRGYEAGDLSLVYPISRSTPALMPIAAYFLVGERLSALGLAGVVVVLIGIWVMQAEGGRLRDRLLDPSLRFAYWTLLATVGYSLTDQQFMLIFGAAEWNSPVPRALAYYYLMTAAHMPFFWWIGGRRLQRIPLTIQLRAEAPRLLVCVVAACVSYSLILEALRTAPVSYVVAARQTSVVFALLIAVFVMGEKPSRKRLVGALATVLGVVVIALA